MAEQRDYLYEVSQFMAAIPHANSLGIKLLAASADGVELELPWSDDLIGNPDTGEMHMGAVTVLLDSICGLCVVCSLKGFEVCPTLDLRLDYLAPVDKQAPLYAHAHAYKVTKEVVFTRGTAWQDDRDNPLVFAVGAFMRMEKDGSFNPSNFTGGKL